MEIYFLRPCICVSQQTSPLSVRSLVSGRQEGRKEGGGKEISQKAWEGEGTGERKVKFPFANPFLCRKIIFLLFRLLLITFPVYNFWKGRVTRNAYICFKKIKKRERDIFRSQLRLWLSVIDYRWREIADKNRQTLEILFFLFCFIP